MPMMAAEPSRNFQETQMGAYITRRITAIAASALSFLMVNEWGSLQEPKFQTFASLFYHLLTRCRGSPELLSRRHNQGTTTQIPRAAKWMVMRTIQ